MEEEKKSISREEWRKEMRKTFCKKDMIDEEGNLVKEFHFLFEFTIQIFSLEKAKGLDVSRGKASHRRDSEVWGGRMGAHSP